MITENTGSNIVVKSHDVTKMAENNLMEPFLLALKGQLSKNSDVKVSLVAKEKGEFFCISGTAENVDGASKLFEGACDMVCR